MSTTQESYLVGVGRHGEACPVYPYPEVLDRIPLNQHAVIEASAGTGKTYTIEHLVVDRLLRTPVRIDQLLVVTFTDKATSELRKRIRDLIERILQKSEEAYLQEEKRLRLLGDDALQKGLKAQEQRFIDPDPDKKSKKSSRDLSLEDSNHALSDETNSSTISSSFTFKTVQIQTSDGSDIPAWIIDIEAQRKLERALFTFDHAAIYTIHAFCRKILVDLAFDSGQLFEQDLVDARHAFRQAWRKALREKLSMHAPLRKQLQDWFHFKGGLSSLENLLYAAYRQGYLELQRPFKHELTMITQRILDAWKYQDFIHFYQSSALVKTALNTAESTLAQIDLVAQSPLSLDEKAKQLLSLNLLDVIQPRRSSSRRKLKFPTDLPKEVQLFIERLKQLQLLAEMEDSIERKAVDGLLPVIAKILSESKRSAGQLDYDDLLRSVWRALCSPQAAQLSQTLRDRFRYALIDEFQDTDPLQWKIFRKVFVDEGSEEHALYIIGDPKQAIYTFRGADVHTYLHARFELRKAGAPRVPLQMNYRSSAAMIDAVNIILDQNAEAAIFQGAIRYEEPVLCGRPDLCLVNEEGQAVSPISLWRFKPPPPTQKRALIPIYQLRQAYLNYLANHIHRLINDPEQQLYLQDAEQKRPITPRDILILVRDNREALEVAKVLREVEVPFALYKPEGLLQGVEAREIYHLLQAIVNPHQKGLRLKAFATPFFGVPWSEVYHYSTLAPGHPKLECLLFWHQLAQQGKYATLFHHLMYHSGLSERELFFAESERELTNYQHIFEIILGITAQNKCTPLELCKLMARYLQGLESPPGSEDNIQRLYSDRPMVQVMTIHKSKGLEAPIIYVYGGFGSPQEKEVNIIHDPDEGRKILVGSVARKTVAQKIKQEQRQEDQRLLYVALTRAQVKVCLPLIDSSRIINGSYAPLKERLYTMYKQDLTQWGSCFEVEEVSDDIKIQYESTGHSLQQWEPPKRLVKIPNIQEDMKEIHRKHYPLLVTSYTRMKQQSGVHSLSEVRVGKTLRVLSNATRSETQIDDHKINGHTPHTNSASNASITSQDGTHPSTTVSSIGDHKSFQNTPLAQLSHMEVERDEFFSDLVAQGEAQSSDEVSQLPGGRHMGCFLHEVIEELSFDDFERCQNLMNWSADQMVIDSFEEIMRRHGIDQRWLAQSQRLIYQALTTTLSIAAFRSSLDTIQSTDGDSSWSHLCHAHTKDSQHHQNLVPDKIPALYSMRHLIEMEFMFPIPEVHHPSLKHPQNKSSLSMSKQVLQSHIMSMSVLEPHPWSVERGFVKGFIDYIFEYEGKVYFVDWKSDVCPSYSGEGLLRHVYDHYLLQSQLYTLGVLRWLNITSEEEYQQRFGGLIYLFLRGFTDEYQEGDGIYFQYPAWNDVLHYEQDLSALIPTYHQKDFNI